MRVGGLEALLHLLQQLPDFVIQPLREFGGQLWRQNPPNVKATRVAIGTPGSPGEPRLEPDRCQLYTAWGQMPRGRAASPEPRSPARPHRSSWWPRTCHSPRRGSGVPAAPSSSRSARLRSARPAPAPPRKAPLPPLAPSRSRGGLGARGCCRRRRWAGLGCCPADAVGSRPVTPGCVCFRELCGAEVPCS